MANLETLELTINANANSASQGLTGLINSLTSLSKKVGKSVGGLKLLNNELVKLGSNGGIKLAGLEKASKGIKNAIDIPTTKLDALKMKMEGVTEQLDKAAQKGNKVTAANKRLQQFSIEKQINAETKAMNQALQAQKKAQEDLSNYDWGNRRAVNKAAPNAVSDEQWQKDFEARQEAIKAREAAQKEQYRIARLQREIKKLPTVEYLEKSPQASQHVKDYIEQSMGIGAKPKSAKESANAFMTAFNEGKETIPIADRIKNSWDNMKQGAKNLGKEIKELIPKFKGLHRVMRLASTMLLRMGIRALFNGVKEGFNNYYQYSKQAGGQFAQEMDSLSSAWQQLRNQMGAAIAPAIGAVIPILNSITSAALTAFNALSQLFALLGGKNSWSKATAQIGAFDAAAKKAGGGGGGMNELLAKFDEFNVIASEGGGGGGGAAAGEEFSTMFEEMYDFDSRIRSLAEFIRETVGWIKDNFTTILEAVGLIGTAILGWKISKAFEGVISTIGKWITGGALITLGVVVGVDIGQKIGAALNGGEGLSGYDIAEGIVGTVAAAIGGYVIAGAAGAMIGIGLTVVATIMGIEIGSRAQLEKMRWGNTSLTPEQVSAYVSSQFKFNVEAEIEVASISLKNYRVAKAHLNGEILEFQKSINKIKLSFDDPEKMIEDAKKKLDSVLSSLNTYINESDNLLTTYLNIMPYDEKTKGIMTKELANANKDLEKYFSNEGQKLANLYDQGMRNGWKGNEQEQIVALLDHINNIFSSANSAATEAKITASLNLTKVKIADFTKGTAEDVLKKQKEILTQYESTMKDMMLEQVSQLEYFATLAEEAGLMDPATGRKLADVYREKAKYIVDSFDTEMTLKLGKTKKTMKQEWINTLSEVYGKDYDTVIRNKMYGLADNLKKYLKKGTEEAKQDMRNDFRAVLESVLSINKITKNAAELYGITGWYLLGHDTKTKFVYTMVNAIGAEAVKLVKSETNISASEMIEVSGWDKFEEAQKLQFIEGLTNAYGAQDAITAAKQAGIDVASAINDGLNSGDEGAKTAASNLVTTIKDTLEKAGVKVDATAEIEVLVDAIVNVTTNTGGGVNVTSAPAVQGTKESAKISFAKFAEGGFPDKGDIFIANERQAELVGSINGRTSVANQEEIISGIQRGVSEANLEQNALLRQQNALLQSILEKDTSVRFGASAALGRTVRQSLDMYSGVVGG